MVVLRNASDAYVSEAHPAKNYANTRKMYVQQGSSNSRWAYIFFSRPFPLHVNITKATLRVWNGSALEGSATMTIQKVASKWSKNKINWNNKPGVFGKTQTVTKASAPAGTLWEIDVTAIMQEVADGGKWFGLRLTINDGVGEWLHSAQSVEKFRPQLEVTWSDAPDAPEDLRPDGGRSVGIAKPTLRFDFTDVAGDTDMNACEVEIGSTAAIVNAGTAEWKSGTVATSQPELDLAGTTYAGLASGSTAYWRVRVQDGAGLWSQWSDVASFVYTPKATLTLLNPPDVASPYVDESTPPINWSFSGTQNHYQIIVAKAASPGDWLWTSGKTTSSDQAVNIPKNVLKRDDTKYRVTVRVWDNLDRESVPDSPAYASISREFILDYDATTDPVMNLKATADAPWPWMKIEWDRATAADQYEIWRDNGDGFEKVDIVDSGDVVDPTSNGTHYIFYDRMVTGRVTQTWKVAAIVNSKASKNNSTVSGKPQASSRWLMDIDGTDAICILNPEVDLTKGEVSVIHRPVKGDPIMITQSRGGFEGTIKGILAGEAIPGLSARAQRERFKRIRNESGNDCILFNVDETMRGFIRNATWAPIARSGGGVDYAVSFEFYERETL